MEYAQYCFNPLRRSSFAWGVGFDALRLWCQSSEGDPLDRTFESLDELEQTYRERVVPLFDPRGCSDLERGDTAAPVADMAAFGRELRACGYDWAEPPRAVDDPVEALVAGLTTSIRRELNRALGAAEVTLEHVVLMVGDAHIKPAIKDPPALAGLGEAEIERVVDGGRSLRWLQGRSLGFSLSHEALPWGELESLWDDPSQYGPYGLLGAALDLVAARIEANPRLRASVSIPGSLRILVAFREMEFVLFERRALAREHIDGLALAYFEQCSRESPD